MADSKNIIESLENEGYKYGFSSDIETDTIPHGLSEEVVRLISQKKGEPQFMLDFRLRAFAKLQTMKMPEWAHLRIPPIDL